MEKTNFHKGEIIPESELETQKNIDKRIELNRETMEKRREIIKPI